MITEKAKLKLQAKNTNDLRSIRQIIEEELDYRFTQDINKYTNIEFPKSKEISEAFHKKHTEGKY